MLPPNIQEWAHRLQLSGAFEFRWGPGPWSRLAGVMIWLIIAYAVIAVLAPESPIKGYTLLGLAALGSVYLIGSWIMAAIFPQSMLDPPHFIKWLNASLAAKGLPSPPDETPVIQNPDYKPIEPPGGGGAGA